MKEEMRLALETMESYSKSVHMNAVTKGFWDSDNISEKIMLVVTELSEAVEAMRKIKKDDIKDICKDNSIIVNRLLNTITMVTFGDLDTIKVVNEEFANTIKDTVGDELADAIIRVMDISEYLGVDIWKHLLMKIAYNSYRPYKHGKTF